MRKTPSSPSPPAWAEANARPKRPAREPRTFARRSFERRRDATAFAPKHRLEHVAGTRAGPGRAQGLQPVVADAAGERRDAVVGDDHAAVAAGERQHGQQVGGDRGAAKVGLEGEQVRAGARCRGAPGARTATAPTTRAPRRRRRRRARLRHPGRRPIGRSARSRRHGRRSIRAPKAESGSLRPLPRRRRARCRGARDRSRGPSDARLRRAAARRRSSRRRASRRRDAARRRRAPRPRRRCRARRAARGCSRRCIRRRPCGAERPAARSARPTSRRARAGSPRPRRPGRRRRWRRRIASS